MKLKNGTTAAFRVIHVDNLEVYLARGALHAANHVPADGRSWRSIHNVAVQGRRATTAVPLGPCGVMLDYLPFHFGPRNMFLYNLHTNHVQGVNFTDGQTALITLVISVEAVVKAGHGFVFYDGHALSALSTCYDTLSNLQRLDWTAIDGNHWPDTEPELKRCKQAEFMVHRVLPYAQVVGIAVCDDAAQQRVSTIQNTFPTPLHRPVAVRPRWYF